MIKPLADRIVVKPAEAEQKTSSGLFIPDNDLFGSLYPG